MLENAISYLEYLVERGGPDQDDYRELAQTFDVIFRQDFTIQNGVSTRIHRTHSLDDFFSNHSDTFRTTSSMQGFAFSKPHGYAGDFEIIERIYSMSNSHKSNIIKWDAFFHYGSAARAVRNRSNLLSELIAELQPSKFLSVGCGPALDVVGAASLFQKQPKIHLLDNDSNAISRAKINTQSCKEIFDTIEYHHKNALRFRSVDTFDLIWCSGLFDYLNDKTAVFLLKKLKSYMAPNATIAIGNFSHDNPSRSYMEIVGEWFLIHRSREDLMRIGVAAGFELDTMSSKADETGLNIFLVARNH